VEPSGETHHCIVEYHEDPVEFACPVPERHEDPVESPVIPALTCRLSVEKPSPLSSRMELLLNAKIHDAPSIIHLWRRPLPILAKHARRSTMPSRNAIWDRVVAAEDRCGG
jgi:hypothetical protein